MNNEVNLGFLTAHLKEEARWTDEYPAWQAYADECERLLEFLQSHHQLDRFWPRLRAKKQQRDEALNEIRVAHFVHSAGYPIIAWEPIDAPGFNVEFAASVGPTSKVFFEVKSPGWESELNDEERKRGRTQQPKHIHLAARWADPIGVIRTTVEKARPKFSGTSPTLVVISDDCFVSLGNWGWGPLQMALLQKSLAYGEGLFHQAKYENIGGVCLFWLSDVNSTNGVQFSSVCMANPNAMPRAAPSAEVLARLCTIPMEPLPQIASQGNTAVR